jgi:hypothetical protein
LTPAPIVIKGRRADLERPGGAARVPRDHASSAHCQSTGALSLSVTFKNAEVPATRKGSHWHLPVAGAGVSDSGSLMSCCQWSHPPSPLYSWAQDAIQNLYAVHVTGWLSLG